MSIRSSFFEFHVATSGLHTARAGLQTVAHNTANAATPGFSRQVANARATTPLQMFNGRGMVGTGSHVFSITQMRDVFLDRKYWGAMPTLGEFSVKRAQMSLNQAVLAELDDSIGLSRMFNSLFETLQDLTENAGDATYRTNVLGSADTLAVWLKDTHEIFMRQQRDVNEEIAFVVSTINSIGYQILTLNERIRVIEISGDNANDLRDQRSLLLDQLSRLVNIEAREETFGPNDTRFFVKINGQDFVMNNNLRTLRVEPRRIADVDEDGGTIMRDVYRNPEDNPGLYDIFWGNGRVRFNIYSPTLSGELRGLIDVRDGNNGNHARVNPGGYEFVMGDGVTPSRLFISPEAFEATRSRMDLSQSGGVIRVSDLNTGFTQEIHYREMRFNSETGYFEFDLIDPPGDGGPGAVLNQLLSNGNRTLTIGQTTDFKGIPYYIDRLNTLVRTFASAVNFGTRFDGTRINDVIGHVEGVNVHGERGEPPTLFFTFRDIYGNFITFDDFDNYAGVAEGRFRDFSIFNIRANNFYVNPDLLRQPLLLNASDPGRTGGDHGVDNNLTLLSWIRINQDNTVFREGKLQDFIIGMTGELAIDIKQADSFERNYNSLTVQIDIQRLSIKGVSVNEEMVDMIRFQQLFQAAARLINVIDAIYGTIVNNLGVT